MKPEKWESVKGRTRRGKEMNVKRKNKGIILWLLWLIEGIVVGFGAILPGISGGTLCVAFGMYRPIIETMSSLKTGLMKHGVKLLIFAIGIAAGFMGLSGVAAYFLERNTALVTCVFVGFILGTIPGLWKDAGNQGRNKRSYLTVGICFIVMLGVLYYLKNGVAITVHPGFAAYILCGILWGFSFIIPGLSSSSLLLFFGLYQPMLEGISQFDLRVLFPMGIGLLACVLILAKIVGIAYEKHYNIVSHGVLGIILATTVMIMPASDGTVKNLFLYLTFLYGGALLSYWLTGLCEKIQEKNAEG